MTFRLRFLAWLVSGLCFTALAAATIRLATWYVSYSEFLGAEEEGAIQRPEQSGYLSLIYVDTFAGYVEYGIGKGDLNGWIGRCATFLLGIGWAFFTFRNGGQPSLIKEDLSIHRPPWFEGLTLGWRRLTGIFLNLVVLGTLTVLLVWAAYVTFGNAKAKDDDWAVCLALFALPLIGLTTTAIQWLVSGFRSA